MSACCMHFFGPWDIPTSTSKAHRLASTILQGTHHALIMASSRAGIVSAGRDVIAHTVVWTKKGYHCWLYVEPNDQSWIQDVLLGKSRLQGRPLLDIQVPPNKWTFITDPYRDVIQPMANLLQHTSEKIHFFLLLSCHASPPGRWLVRQTNGSPSLLRDWLHPLLSKERLSLILFIDTCYARSVCPLRTNGSNLKVALAPKDANMDSISKTFGFGGQLSCLFFDHILDSAQTIESFPHFV